MCSQHWRVVPLLVPCLCTQQLALCCCCCCYLLLLALPAKYLHGRLPYKGEGRTMATLLTSD
jgi:hypothetical protein